MNFALNFMSIEGYLIFVIRVSSVSIGKLCCTPRWALQVLREIISLDSGGGPMTCVVLFEAHLKRRIPPSDG